MLKGKQKSNPKVNLADLTDIPSGAAMIFHKPKTLENWLSAGKLKRYKVGKRPLVSRSELEALVRG